ncbi:site-specific integrase [Paucisalibacillus globulus]|uniref:site-specific integrase n=1 Tax=Paucisalibacillus globulus TaxID=351095 RepID=UPI0003FCF6A4|nr:site-specific integrase [Paucisalibacillus globulus]
MNVVQPIRDYEKLEEIKRILKANNERDYIMVMVGLYTALRISDILRIRVEDIKKDYMNIREKKTGKARRIYLNNELKKALKDYIQDKEPHEYLIRSREGINNPITRARAYGVLKDVAEEVGLDSIGTHSLRKTFGYWAYKDTKDVAALQKLFNHSYPEETLRYIGIEQDGVDQLLKNAYRNARG